MVGDADTIQDWFVWIRPMALPFGVLLHFAVLAFSAGGVDDLRRELARPRIRRRDADRLDFDLDLGVWREGSPIIKERRFDR